MPVIDWIRTDLQISWEDGTSSLFRQNPFCLLRPEDIGTGNADYSPEELDKVAEPDKVT